MFKFAAKHSQQFIHFCYDFQIKESEVNNSLQLYIKSVYNVFFEQVTKLVTHKVEPNGKMIKY